MQSLRSQDDSEPRGLLRVLAYAFSGALFGLFLSKLKTPQQQAVRGMSPNKETPEERKHGPALPSFTSQIPTPPTDPQYPFERCHYSTPWWKVTLEILMVAFTGGAFGAAAFYANISYRQWRSQIEATKIDQRAWVTVSEVSQKAGKNGDVSVRVTFKNTGKTPAKAFSIRVVDESVARGGTPVAEEKDLPGIGIIAPEGFFHSDMNVGSGYDWKANDMFIHGRIEYDSVFAEHHWTRFCYYRITDEKNGTSGFAACESGNDVDPNPP